MSDHAGYGPVATRILSLNTRFPFIIVGLLLMMTIATVGNHYHVHVPHAVEEVWHEVQHLVHLSLWLFFLVMGAEIDLGRLRQSGAFVFGTIAGGMVVPFGLTLGLLFFFTDVPEESLLPLAYGAMATDVPISVSIANMITGGAEILVLLIQDTIFPLAIGDDLGGVFVMTMAYLEGVKWDTLTFTTTLLGVAYMLGERGLITVDVRREGSEKRHTELYLHVDSVPFWVWLATLCTFLLIDLGAEMIIGGCLVMIFAPKRVKAQVIHALEPVMPIVLLLFGFSVGGIDLMDAEAFGPVTASAFVGGHFGKIIGVSGMGFIVRHFLPEGELYKRIPTGQILSLGILAAVNGTVAIIFVEMGMQAGKIPELYAVQAKLGFFLTIFASLGEVLFIKYLMPKFVSNWFFGDDPDFQPLSDDALAA
jgi:Kef-type K+ transport system membrane component KefB